METCKKCGRECKDSRGLRLHKCKPEKKAEEMTTKTDTTNPITLSTEERGIADRAQAQDTDWFTIREDELNDFSLMADPLFIKNTMPEAWKLQEEKKYAFRWCERKTQRIDELTKSVSPPLRWALVTRTTLPELEKYIDPVLGCIANLDQALLFKPWSHHQIVKEAKQRMADDRANASGMDAVAKTRSDDKVKMFTDDKAKIGGTDDVQYEDGRSYEGEHDLGELVVDE
jgi:hypothetical protein